jgi:hypothetical protein
MGRSREGGREGGKEEGSNNLTSSCGERRVEYVKIL